MKKSFYHVLLFLVAASMILAACQPAATQAPATPTTGAAQPTTAATKPAATAVPTATIAPADPNAVKISFWHSMAGDIGGKAIPQMANDFNASQKQCHVTPIYQGTYDDSLNKLKAGLQGKDIPAV